LIFLNNDDANIQFNLITDDEYDLTVILSEQGIKDAQKEFKYPKNNDFYVNLDLRHDRDYSIAIILENDKLKFSSIMTAELGNYGREFGNYDLHLYSLHYLNRFQIMASMNEGEPNNTLATATTVPNDTNVTGSISSSSDIDYFKIVLPVKQKINVFLGDVCSDCDYDLYLYNSSGTTIAWSVNGKGSNELISNQVLEAGTYYARVNAFLNYDSTKSYLFRWKATQSWPAVNTTSANITSPFGPRWGTNHNGIDISRGVNDPIVAAFDGVVTAVGYDNERGNYVIIDSVVNDENVQTRYQHLVDNSIVVNIDDTVVAGQSIGTMGTTGFSTGIHLHFETRTGSSVTPVDPMQNHFLNW